MGANTVIEQSPGVVIVTGAALVPNVQSVNTKTGAVSLAASDVGAPSLAQLAGVASGQGASLIGWPAGYGVNQAATSQFYTGNGAGIHRFNDRIFLGAATVNDGAYPNVTKDWLTTFQTGYGVPGAIVSAQFAALTSTNPASGQAIVGGAQTTQFTAANAAAIGISGYGLSNNATYKDYAWAFYGEGHRTVSGTGGAWGMELDVTNYGDAVYIDPYGTETGTVGGQVLGLQINGGAAYPATGQQNPSAAILIGANPVPFDKGLIFQQGSLGGTYAEAISMASGHSLQWYAATNTRTSRIFCSGTTTSGGTWLSLLEGGAFFQNASSGTSNFGVLTQTNGVNFFTVIPSVSGSPPILGISGSDTNVDIQIQPKGTGLVRFGSYTAGTITATGYISVNDFSGTLRRILVG